jgi:hypothetical protein
MKKTTTKKAVAADPVEMKGVSLDEQDAINRAFFQMTDKLHLVHSFLQIAEDAVAGNASHNMEVLSNSWGGLARVVQELIDITDALQTRVGKAVAS